MQMICENAERCDDKYCGTKKPHVNSDLCGFFYCNIAKKKVKCKPVEKKKMDTITQEFLVKTVRENICVNSALTLDDIREAIQVYWIDTKQIEVTEITDKPAFEIPVVETGVLMSPAEITKCESVTDLEFINSEGKKCYLNKGNAAINSRIEIADAVYPLEFYKDIRTETDYSKIKVGSVVKVKYKDKEDKYIYEVAEIYESFFKDQRGYDRSFDSIESLEVLKEGV